VSMFTRGATNEGEMVIFVPSKKFAFTDSVLAYFV
jgi:hypothetical protein